ncbi:MAG: AI-2E family transporter [Anaerolineae bacterium]|nr:AI-2E family transporter [Anaerolineae bacterium]
MAELEDQEASPGPVLESPMWTTWTRRLVTIVLLIAGVYATTFIRPVLQTLIISCIVTFLLFAPARAITRRSRVPYAASVVWFYVLFILIGFFLLIVLVPSLINWGNSLLRNVQDAYNDLKARAEHYEYTNGIVNVLGNSVNFNVVIEPLRVYIFELPPVEVPEEYRTDMTALLEEAGTAPQPPGGSIDSFFNSLQLNFRDLLNSAFGVVGSVTGTLTTAVTGVAGFLFQALMVLFLSFLLLLDIPRAYNAFFDWIPKPYHREYALLLERIIDVWNGFFRGQVIIGFVIGLLTWLQLVLMGIPGAEMIAVFTGIVSLIPTVGGLAALIPMALVPLLQGSAVFPDMQRGTLVLLVLGINLVMQQVIWNVVAPKILGEAVALPLPVILVGIFIGTAVGGILGAFLISPILGTIKVLLDYTFKKLGNVDPYPDEPEPALLHNGLFAPPPSSKVARPELKQEGA